MTRDKTFVLKVQTNEELDWKIHIFGLDLMINKS